MICNNPTMRSAMMVLTLLLAVCWIRSANAVIGLPFGNVKVAEKLEAAGQFAKALEARELAAEFCEYFSIPEFADDLEFFQKRGNLKQVEYTEGMLKQFREWAKVSREKAAANSVKAELTPAQRQRYHQRIRRQLLGAAEFYPEIHNGQLGIQVSNLERDGIVASDFEKATEGRERTARLYEEVSIPYVLHAIADAKSEGDSKAVERLEAKLAEYRAKVAENSRKAKENQERAAELRKLNQPANLRAMLDRPDAEARLSAIEAAEASGTLEVLRAGLSNDQPAIRMRAYEGVERKLDIRGLLYAKFSNDKAIAERATKTLGQDDEWFRSVLVERLIDALNAENRTVGTNAYHELLAYTGPHFDWSPDKSPEVRRAIVKEWQNWLNKQLKPGLLGIYYQGKDFNAQKAWRADSKLDFHWRGSPHPDVTKDRYSIRWVGKLEVPESQTYRIFTFNDDGVRVWIDYRKVIDDWNQHALVPQEGTIHLNAGQHDLLIEFFNEANDATIQLLWATDKMPQAMIPPENLWHFDPASKRP